MNARTFVFDSSLVLSISALNRNSVKEFNHYFSVIRTAMLPYILFRWKREYQFDGCAVAEVAVNGR